ncbi:MAG: zinc ABC transporter substrate-binding protein [Chloroflexota bacterium]|nr:zinc ABC transporter substrate-binding protein [Chloroflexota bacterium]
MKRSLFTLVILYSVIFGAVTLSAQDAPIRAVATFSILGDLVQTVAADHVQLTILVGADADSHVYEPSPQDAIALSEADIIFENGLGFESWLDELVEASGSDAVRVVVSAGIAPLAFAEGEHEDHEDADHPDEATPEATHEAGDHDEDEHGESDPHVWHDPNNAIVMVANIRDALTAIDPAHSDEFAANAEALVAELTALDTTIRAQVALIPEANRILVTSHDTFGYFADEYGFAVETVLGAISTDAADPGAGELAELIGHIQESGVPAIFTENISNPDLLERVASEAGVTVAPSLYTDALGEAGTPGATFLGMLRYNIDTITQALR